MQRNADDMGMPPADACEKLAAPAKVAETYSTEGPQCPYCKRQFTADEGFYYDEMLDALDCDECEKTFNVRVYTSTSWTCGPRDQRKL